jgi:hypothetical protein
MKVKYTAMAIVGIIVGAVGYFASRDAAVMAMLFILWSKIYDLENKAS